MTVKTGEDEITNEMFVRKINVNDKSDVTSSTPSTQNTKKVHERHDEVMNIGIKKT